jgi:hypothetical protein
MNRKERKQRSENHKSGKDLMGGLSVKLRVSAGEAVNLAASFLVIPLNVYDILFHWFN